MCKMCYDVLHIRNVMVTWAMVPDEEENQQNSPEKNLEKVNRYFDGYLVTHPLLWAL